MFHGSDDYWGIDETEVLNQGSIAHHIRSVDGRYERVSMPFRYVWPSELDLMAQVTGMRLRERWGGWNRDPFTNESRKHISVWESTPPVHEISAAPEEPAISDCHASSNVFPIALTMPRPVITIRRFVASIGAG